MRRRPPSRKPLSGTCRKRPVPNGRRPGGRARAVRPSTRHPRRRKAGSRGEERRGERGEGRGEGRREDGEKTREEEKPELRASTRAWGRTPSARARTGSDTPSQGG